MKANQNFVQAMQTFIDEEKVKNEALALAMEKNKERDMQGCGDWIMRKAKELANGENSFCMSSDDVYQLARDYFMLEVIEEKKIEAPKKPVPTPIPVIKSKPTKDNSKMVIGDLFALFDEPQTTK